MHGPAKEVWILTGVPKTNIVDGCGIQLSVEKGMNARAWHRCHLGVLVGSECYNVTMTQSVRNKDQANKNIISF